MEGKQNKERWRRWLAYLMLSIIAAIAINQYGISLSVVSGTSMKPTIHNGDHLLINKFNILWKEPRIGEVVTFQDPKDTSRYLVKRVVGIPGDLIEIKEGFLYRNGQLIKEEYIDTKIEDGNFGPVMVKKDTIFVMGDNRHRYASRDSRYQTVGLVPFNLINGKVELILWRPSLAASL